ncbi:MAG: GGDEF domain-containing protein [Planctomycetota bacterium]|nr:GGDEF domain-containing protein [Planctomycetota bacterium]
MSDEQSPNPGPRQRRARLLIVGDDGAAAALGRDLSAPPARAANLFDAIGAVSAAEARQPIAAILIPESQLPASPQPALEALKRVDPSVQLIRVVENGRVGDATPIEGFDEAIEAPIAEDTIARILAEGMAVRPAPAQSAGTGIDEERVEAPAIATAGDDLTLDDDQDAVATATPQPPEMTEVPTGRGGEPVGEEADAAAPGGAPPLPSRHRPPPPPPPSARPAPGPPVTETLDDLGDTDLIEAVMGAPEGVREAALRLIRQQTGWTDIELRDDGTVPPPEKAHAEVLHDGGSYGLLITGMAATKELLPWARWLGYWLALDGAYRDYRLMAFSDDLTGAWNRRYFNRFLEETIRTASVRRRPLTVMIFDIDDFKLYNDRYGHEAGDVILRETVSLLNSVIRESDRVCRIGGDEFAVIFADVEGPREFGSSHPESVEQIARRFQEQICRMRFPKLGPEALGSLSISAGLATYPWDGLDPSTLLSLADRRALESKRKGKNSITYGPGAAEPCPPESV